MIREANRDAVLTCLRRCGRASRAELHRETGLTKPTISKIVEELLELGVLREGGLTASVAGGGRPSRCIELNASSAAYAGVELDTDRTRVAVADYTGRLRHIHEGPAPTDDPAASLDYVAKVLRKTLRSLGVPWARLDAVGVTVPSLVDPASGHCFLAPTLGWREVPLADELAARLDAPVAVANVPQAAALAESRWGAARCAQSFVWVFVGSGIGAGIVEGGRVFLGQRGLSGEFGHCRVVEDGEPCGCGKRGCLETVASLRAMADEWLVRCGRARPRKKARTVEGVTAWQRAVSAGEEHALQSLRWGARHMGLGLSLLINVLDPELVVLGGYATALGEPYLHAARASAIDNALAPERVNVRLSTLGDDAALWGALLTGVRRSARVSHDELFAGVSGPLGASQASACRPGG